MEPSPYSERFTIACNHSRESAGEVPGSGCQLGEVPGSGCQLGEVLGAAHLGGQPVASWCFPYMVPC